MHLRGTHFWLVFAMFALMMGAPAYALSRQFGEVLDPSYLAVVTCGFLLLHLGGWSFVYEDEDCARLVFYPVAPWRIVLGKTLSAFFVIVPLMAIVLAQNARHGGSLFEHGGARIAVYGSFQLFCCALAVIVGGATANYSAKSLLAANTLLSMLVQSGAIVINLAFLAVILSLLSAFPAVLWPVAAVYLALTYAAVRLGVFFIPGLRRTLGRPVATRAASNDPDCDLTRLGPRL